MTRNDKIRVIVVLVIILLSIAFILATPVLRAKGAGPEHVQYVPQFTNGCGRWMNQDPITKVCYFRPD